MGSWEWEKRSFFPLPTPHSPLPLFSFLHSQNPERFGHMIIVAARRLPGDAFAVGRRALEAVEVDAQFLACLRFSLVDLVNRDTHLAVPYLLVGDDARLHFKARIPFHFVVEFRGAAVNIQIHPFALRRSRGLRRAVA